MNYSELKELDDYDQGDKHNQQWPEMGEVAEHGNLFRDREHKGDEGYTDDVEVLRHLLLVWLDEAILLKQVDEESCVDHKESSARWEHVYKEGDPAD